jgi:hypothetical protein
MGGVCERMELQGESGGGGAWKLGSLGPHCLCLASSLCACPAGDVGAGGDPLRPPGMQRAASGTPKIPPKAHMGALT